MEMDAATSRKGHVISGLWNGSKDMATLVIGPYDWRPRATACFVELARATRELGKAVFGPPQACPGSGVRKVAPAHSLGHRHCRHWSRIGKTWSRPSLLLSRLPPTFPGPALTAPRDTRLAMGRKVEQMDVTTGASALAVSARLVKGRRLLLSCP